MTRRGQGQACLGRLASSGQGLLILRPHCCCTQSNYTYQLVDKLLLDMLHPVYSQQTDLITTPTLLCRTVNFFSVTVTTFRQDFITGLIKYRPKENIKNPLEWFCSKKNVLTAMQQYVS